MSIWSTLAPLEYRHTFTGPGGTRTRAVQAVPEATAIAEAIPGAQLTIFSGCGHWPLHKQAERYNALSLAFLAEVSGGCA